MSTPMIPCAHEHCRCLVERPELTDQPYGQDDLELGETLDEAESTAFCSPSCGRQAEESTSEPMCRCAHPECDAADT